jgi:hypothetical protein
MVESSNGFEIFGNWVRDLLSILGVQTTQILPNADRFMAA